MIEYVPKSDQLQYIRITVDRFFKRTLSLDRFLKLAFVLDRFFIGGSVNSVALSNRGEISLMMT